MNNSDMILWRTASSFHDWNDLAFPRRLLDRAQALGLIGAPEWIKRGVEGEKEPAKLRTAGELVEQLVKPKRGEAPGRYLEAGGNSPVAWTVKLNVAQLGPDQKPKMPNNLWLFFDRRALSVALASKGLADAFLELNTPRDSEYALIHPYQHWLDFSHEHYAIPVTMGLMFKGVVWGNFLGPGHLGEFDLERLEKLPADRVQWIGKEGLFAITTPNVLSATEKAAEAAMLRLNQRFQEALLPTSKWSKD
jgi:hypothetical protein